VLCRFEGSKNREGAGVYAEMSAEVSVWEGELTTGGSTILFEMRIVCECLMLLHKGANSSRR